MLERRQRSWVLSYVFPSSDMRRVTVVLACLSILLLPLLAHASHSWSGYHWARTANPFTLKLGDNVSGVWDGHLSAASGDWNASSVLDTSIVVGQGGKNCRAAVGHIEVCNKKYGQNGWLGIAQIWINGDGHIIKGLAKMNDTYFNMPTYNTIPWRNLVMCQEVAHAFGLDHQDESFSNPNLGTCMDYTGDPDGPPSNEHPNAHDFEQLEAIYAHLDGYSTIGANLPELTSQSANLDEPRQWGKIVKKDGKGRPSLYEKDLGNGHKVFTHVFWAE